MEATRAFPSLHRLGECFLGCGVGWIDDGVFAVGHVVVIVLPFRLWAVGVGHLDPAGQTVRVLPCGVVVEVDLHGASVRESRFEVVAHGVAALGDFGDVGVLFEQSSGVFRCQWHSCAPFLGFLVSTFRLAGFVGFGRQSFEFGLFLPVFVLVGEWFGQCLLRGGEFPFGVGQPFRELAGVGGHVPDDPVELADDAGWSGQVGAGHLGAGFVFVDGLDGQGDPSGGCRPACDDGQSVVFGYRVPVVRLVGGLVEEPACGLPVADRLAVDGHALPSAVHARGLVDAQGLGGERLVVGLLADRLADSLDAWLELLADVPAGVGLLLRP